VTTYDSLVRSDYLTEVQSASKEAVKSITATEKAVQAGKLSPEEGLKNIEQTSKTVSAGRDVARTEAQSKLSPGGRKLSAAIDTPMTFEARLAKKAAGAATEVEALKEVARAAGKSHLAVSGLAKAGKYLGPVGTGVGVGLGIAAVATAPEGEKMDVAVEETVAFGAGAVGSTLGTAAAVAGTTALVAAGVIAAPGVIALIGIALVGAAIGGYFFSEFGRAGTRFLQGR